MRGVFRIIGEWLAGLAAGIVGLVPLAHPNTLLPFIALQNNFESAVFITAFAFSHLAFETVSSVFLAAPGAIQTAVAPAVEQARLGNGRAVLSSTLQAMLFGLALSIALLPLAFAILPIAFEALAPIAGWALLGLIGFAASRTWSERGTKIALLALAMFALSSAFGFIAFNSGLARAPLFPVLAGLFGIPALFRSPNDEKAQFVPVSKTRFAILAGSVLGLCSVLLPALTPSLLAAIALLFLERSPTSMLSFAGSLSSSRILFDFVGVHSFNHPRSGAAVAVQQALGNPSAWQIVGLAGAGIASLAIACTLALFASGPLAAVQSKFPKALRYAALLLVAGGVAVVNSGGGLLLLGAGAALGLFCAQARVPQSWVAGALVGPSLLYFFGVHVQLAGLLLD